MSNPSSPTEINFDLIPDHFIPVPMAPLLEFPQRTPTPLLTERTITPAFIQRAIQDARWREERLHTAVHAAMVAQVPHTLGATLVEAIRVFSLTAPQALSTARTREVLDPAPSLPPLPVCPCPDTPFPTDIIRAAPSPTPTFPPPYSPQRSQLPTLVPFSPTPSLPYIPRTPSPDPPELWGDENRPPTTQEPGHPGPSWIPNTTEEGGGIHHDISIPGPGGVEPARWVQYDFDTNSPELLATMGWGYTTHSFPLTARPRPYPIAPLTKKERFLFHANQMFTPLVDGALDRERDVGLRGEVQRFRRANRRAQDLTCRLADMKVEYNEARTEAQESTTCLAEADAYGRLMTHVLTSVMDDKNIPPGFRHQGLALIGDGDAVEPCQRAPTCGWTRVTPPTASVDKSKCAASHGTTRNIASTATVTDRH
ncbi:hypothetical protein F5888DRAFT_1632909 [Russula emetica]|nr:hypothetical protein F5888DRAFT_1632909 [Russula emetica]